MAVLIALRPRNLRSQRGRNRHFMGLWLSPQEGLAMTEHTVEITCSECGLQLVGPEGKTNPEANDVVRCPVHGDVGRLDDVIEQAHATIRREFPNIFEKAMRQAGIKFTKDIR